jgi:RNA polymerase sigma-70 factor (ECF subfamily)
VFLLRAVFGYGYDEIGEAVGRSEGNCPQLAARARRRVEARTPRFQASRKQREELARRSFAAIEEVGRSHDRADHRGNEHHGPPP